MASTPVNHARYLFCAVLLATLIGCASRPATGRTARPTVTIAQTSAVAPLRVALQGGVPVDYRLDIANPLDHSVTLTSVEIETVGLSGGYTMKRVRHAFAQIIPAHTTATIALRAWVQPLQETDTGQVASPVMLRGTARFEAKGSMIQSAFAGRAQGAAPLR